MLLLINMHFAVRLFTIRLSHLCVAGNVKNISRSGLFLKIKFQCVSFDSQRPCGTPHGHRWPWKHFITFQRCTVFPRTVSTSQCLFPRKHPNCCSYFRFRPCILYLYIPRHIHSTVCCYLLEIQTDFVTLLFN